MGETNIYSSYWNVSEQNYLTSDNQLTKVEENKWAFSVKGISSPEADGNVPAIKASESQSHKES